MGIHYDYKSTRGDKAMKKEAKRKARIEQRRAKRQNNNPDLQPKKQMHDTFFNMASQSHYRN